MSQPIMSISSSEPVKIINALKEISIINTHQIYPDYIITSRLGYTVGIARGTTNDIISNKLDVHSHISEELSRFHTDLKIFLQEDFLKLFSCIL